LLLKSKSFLINNLYQLGLIISLDKNDIEDLSYIYNEYQYDIAKYEFFNNKLREELKKHNDLFLELGLRELINDEYKIEESDIKDYTYYVTLSFKMFYFNNFFVFGFLFVILSIIALFAYVI
jgi:hypothetical protein